MRAFPGIDITKSMISSKASIIQITSDAMPYNFHTIQARPDDEESWEQSMLDNGPYLYRNAMEWLMRLSILMYETERGECAHMRMVENVLKASGFPNTPVNLRNMVIYLFVKDKTPHQRHCP